MVTNPSFGLLDQWRDDKVFLINKLRVLSLTYYLKMPACWKGHQFFLHELRILHHILCSSIAYQMCENDKRIFMAIIILFLAVNVLLTG